MWPVGDPTKLPGPPGGGLRTRADGFVIVLLVMLLAMIVVPLVLGAVVE